MEDIQREEIEALDRELLRRLEQERYRFYEPSTKAEQFINAVASPGNFATLFSAANGIGKSVTGANIIANTLFESDNPFFQHDLFRNWPYPKRARIATTPTNIVKNIIPSLQFWFPHESLGMWSARKEGKQYLSDWKTKTGWDLDIMSYEQDAMEYEGPTIGLAWLDEPPPEAIFKAIVSRMRMGGIIIITATPLAGSAYLYDTFNKGYTIIEIEGPNGAKIAFERKVSYIEADVWSACRDVAGTRGHLSKEHILQMIAEYDEEDKQARIYGKFQHLIGLVFKTYSRNVHVIDPFPIKPEDYVVWEMLDPHPRNPDAVMWVAIDKYGRKFVVDELYKPVESDKDLAFYIKQKASQYRIVKRIADPSAFNVNQHDRDSRSLADKLSQDHGLTYEPGTKSRAMADKRIKDALKHNVMNGHIITPPELYFFSSCERTLFEMEHYRWQEWAGKSADQHNKKETPIDKDDHMIEDLGRCLIQEPKFFPLIAQPHSTGYQSSQSLDPYD